MLSFQRKSLSFESALSYLQAVRRKSHALLWKRSSLFKNFNSLCGVNRVLLHFLNAVLSKKSLSCESALCYLPAFTSNSHAFLWKRSSLFQHFNSLCEVNGWLIHFLNAVHSEKITFLWNYLSYIQAFTSNSHEFLWKRSSLFQHFNSLCKVNGVLLHFLNAVHSEKITFLWNYLSYIQAFTSNSHEFLWKRNSLSQHFNHCAK